MASLTASQKELFPLKTIDSVVSLFRSILLSDEEPNLALASILVGYIENTLCLNPTPSNNTTTTLSNDKQGDTTTTEDFPQLELEIVEGLLAKFRATVKSAVDVTQYVSQDGYTNRELVLRVSDVIWNSLMRRYQKDRAHMQNIYTYLTGNKLDAFGVALAVVAGCQVLECKDVHLALSEDHVWVAFGLDGKETAEVTWHGNEDKRGQVIDAGLQGKSWLYAGGKPVTGNRFIEVAVIVSSINPAISATTENQEVASLQHKLLWLLYELGHLSRYPMALGNLADLEEFAPSNLPNRPSCDQLFKEAIEISRTVYDDYHVYPHTYQGSYFYRNQMHKEALESWANAANVLRKYNYSREDEEIYKEFLEIANELIPQIIKNEASGHSARSILRDPECFARLLHFYDGICQWEEESTTPVLHIGWAKPLVSTISKFDAEIRRLVDIECLEKEKGETENETELDSQKKGVHHLVLKSQKMAGLKDLLISEKLNTQAISLQLTAQSQVQLGGRKPRDDTKDSKADNKETTKDANPSRSKRLRKE